MSGGEELTESQKEARRRAQRKIAIIQYWKNFATDDCSAYMRRPKLPKLDLSDQWWVVVPPNYKLQKNLDTMYMSLKWDKFSERFWQALFHLIATSPTFKKNFLQIGGIRATDQCLIVHRDLLYEKECDKIFMWIASSSDEGGSWYDVWSTMINDQRNYRKQAIHDGLLTNNTDEYRKWCIGVQTAIKQIIHINELCKIICRYIYI
jgi:hypothetical protein